MCTDSRMGSIDATCLQVMGGVRDAAQLIRDRGGNDRNGEYDEQLLRGVNSDASYA